MERRTFQETSYGAFLQRLCGISIAESARSTVPTSLPSHSRRAHRGDRVSTMDRATAATYTGSLQHQLVAAAGARDGKSKPALTAASQLVRPHGCTSRQGGPIHRLPAPPHFRGSPDVVTLRKWPVWWHAGSGFALQGGHATRVRLTDHPRREELARHFSARSGEPVPTAVLVDQKAHIDQPVRHAFRMRLVRLW